MTPVSMAQVSARLVRELIDGQGRKRNWVFDQLNARLQESERMTYPTFKDRVRGAQPWKFHELVALADVLGVEITAFVPSDEGAA